MSWKFQPCGPAGRERAGLGPPLRWYGRPLRSDSSGDGGGRGDACSCDGLMVGGGAQKQRTHTSTERMHTDTVWGQRGVGGQEDLGSSVW